MVVLCGLVGVPVGKTVGVKLCLCLCVSVCGPCFALHSSVLSGIVALQRLVDCVRVLVCARVGVDIPVFSKHAGQITLFVESTLDRVCPSLKWRHSL